MRAFHHTFDHTTGHHQVEHRTGRAAPWFVLAALAFLAALISG